MLNIVRAPYQHRFTRSAGNLYARFGWGVRFWCYQPQRKRCNFYVRRQLRAFSVLQFNVTRHSARRQHTLTPITLQRVSRSTASIYLPTALAREIMQSPPSVRPSISLFVSTLSSESTDRWPWTVMLSRGVGVECWYLWSWPRSCDLRSWSSSWS